MQTPTSIRRLPIDSLVDFDREIVATGKPVIITGALDEFGIIRKWSSEYILSACGAQNVPVRFFLDQHACRSVPMTVSEYMDRIRASSTGSDKYYLVQVPLSLFPNLRKELPPTDHWGHPYDRHQIFIGRRSFTQLHFHPGEDSLSSQINGEKRFVLFPPESSRYLAPMPWYSMPYNYSKINLLDSPEELYQKWPEFKNTQPLDCILQPGDILFTPRDWWHVVYGLGSDVDVLLVTFFHARFQYWHFPFPGIRTLFWRLPTAHIGRLIGKWT